MSRIDIFTTPIDYGTWITKTICEVSNVVFGRLIIHKSRNSLIYDELNHRAAPVIGVEPI